MERACDFIRASITLHTAAGIRRFPPIEGRYQSNGRKQRGDESKGSVSFPRYPRLGGTVSGGIQATEPSKNTLLNNKAAHSTAVKPDANQRRHPMEESRKSQRRRCPGASGFSAGRRLSAAAIAGDSATPGGWVAPVRKHRGGGPSDQRGGNADYAGTCEGGSVARVPFLSPAHSEHLTGVAYKLRGFFPHNLGRVGVE